MADEILSDSIGETTAPSTKDTEACLRQVRAWAEDVWQTYSDQHLPAREWIRIRAQH